MDLYLLEDYQFNLMLKRALPRSVSGAANLFLRDKMLSPRGQGVVADKRFPWAVDYLKDSKETGMFGFNLSVSFDAKLAKTPPMLTTIVKGNFVDLLKYVYGISKAPKYLKLTFGATLALSCRSRDQCCITVFHDMKTCTENGAVEFIVANILDKKSAENIWEHGQCSETAATMTVKLTAESEPISVQLEGLNEKIFHGKRNPDFVLISENDVEFPCHKGFLNAHSSFFERMFEADCKETRSGKAKPNLSEEGLKAFLDFVYCFKVDFPKEHPRIAVELLEFAHEKQVRGLEEAMKELIVGKPQNWMDLIDWVQLFLLSVKLDFEHNYDDVKKAAVKAIKAKRDQLMDSEVCKELLKTNPEANMELLRICLE